MQGPTIVLKNISLAYQQKLILSDLNLTLPGGKWIGLIGPSGIGKSSLIKAIAGIETEGATFSGEISADNQVPVTTQTAYLSQHDTLLPWLTVFDNALLPLTLRPTVNHAREAFATQTLALLNAAGLQAAHHLYPHQLSGGMRQRVALVRTLLEEKPLILLDEPFAALDAITRRQLQNLAIHLLAQKTVLFITHDPLEALRMADAIYLLSGSPARIKQVAELSAGIPRDASNEMIDALQQELFQTLSARESWS